jgi:hypothetical protein
MQCRVTVDGTPARARAFLESAEVILRGDARLRLPFEQLRRVEASAGTLTLRSDEHLVELELGNRAERWAERIRNPRTLIDKLGVKSGARIGVLGVDDDGFLGLLRARAGSVATGARGNELDAIFVQVDTAADLDRIASLERSIIRNGAIWVISPRGRAELTELDVLTAGRAAGLVDTKVVRFSDTHTAHKFAVPTARR